MTILFRANASKYEKAYTLFCAAIFAALAYGFSNAFEPSATVISISPYLALAGCLVFFVPLFLDRHPANKIPTYGLVKRAIVYLVVLAGSYLLALGVIAIGLPAVATRLVGEPFAEDYKVIAKGRGEWSVRRYCSRYAVHVRGGAPVVETRTCPSEEFWQQAKVGDTVFMSGHKSSLGALHEDVKLR